MNLPHSINKRLKFPVIAAPMFLVSSPQLVINACKEGIIGSFPMTNARPISTLEKWMKEISSSIDKDDAPYAVNMVVHSSYERFEKEKKLIEKYQPEIVITSLGDPSRITESVHDYGGTVWSDVNSMKYARIAAAKGVDGLILVCSGAGGHTGNISPFAFVEAVSKFWDKTIILAGGISTGRNIKAAQVMGADLVYIGTKFIASEESLVDTEYREMLISSGIEDLILTDGITGVPAHFLKKSLNKAGYDVNKAEKKDFDTEFLDTDIEGDAWKDIWSAGQGVEMIDDVMPIKEIIKQLYSEYEDCKTEL